MPIDYSKIRKIELKSKLLAESINRGLYSSAFKGSGLDYHQSREYIEGDDVRRIDPLVSARLGSLYIKLFEEERQINVIIIADVSSSMFVGESGISKFESMLDFVALIAYSAYYNNDNIGLLLFSNSIKKFFPPDNNPNTIPNIINSLININYEQSNTSISIALEYIMKVQHQSAIIFIISDFHSESFEKELKIVQSKFDTILIHITDNISIPDDYRNGFIKANDIENNDEMTLNINDCAHNIQFVPKSLKNFINSNVIMNNKYLRIKAGDNILSKFINFMEIRGK